MDVGFVCGFEVGWFGFGVGWGLCVWGVLGLDFGGFGVGVFVLFLGGFG